MSNVRIELQTYMKNISNGFARYRQNGDFVDMTIAAEGHLVKVHRIIMSLSSPYIEEILKTTPCTHPVIFLNNVSHDVLSYILEYIYTGVVRVAWNFIEEFTATCKQLHIIGMKDCHTPILGSACPRNKIAKKSKTAQPKTVQNYIPEPMPVETESLQENHTVQQGAPTTEDADDDNISDTNNCDIGEPFQADQQKIEPFQTDDNQNIKTFLANYNTNIETFQTNDNANIETFQTNGNADIETFQTNGNANMETFQTNPNQNIGALQTNVNANIGAFQTNENLNIGVFEANDINGIFQIDSNNIPNEGPSTEAVAAPLINTKVKYKIDLSNINLDSINDMNLQPFINPIPIENIVDDLLHGKVPEYTIDLTTTSTTTPLVCNIQESVKNNYNTVSKHGLENGRSDENKNTGSKLKRPATQYNIENTAPNKFTIKRMLTTNPCNKDIENSAPLKWPVQDVEDTVMQNIIPIHQINNGITKEYISEDVQNSVLTEQVQNENTDQNTGNEDSELPDHSKILLSPTPLFILSTRGNIQMILKRYLYGTSFNAFNGSKRRWRCVSYRATRCEAYVDTANETVLYRVGEHNHGVHDKQILRKGRDSKIFTTISEARIYALENNIT